MPLERDIVDVGLLVLLLEHAGSCHAIFLLRSPESFNRSLAICFSSGGFQHSGDMVFVILDTPVSVVRRKRSATVHRRQKKATLGGGQRRRSPFAQVFRCAQNSKASSDRHPFDCESAAASMSYPQNLETSQRRQVLAQKAESPAALPHRGAHPRARLQLITRAHLRSQISDRRSLLIYISGPDPWYHRRHGHRRQLHGQHFPERPALFTDMHQLHTENISSTPKLLTSLLTTGPPHHRQFWHSLRSTSKPPTRWPPPSHTAPEATSSRSASLIQIRSCYTGGTRHQDHASSHKTIHSGSSS